MRRVATAWGSTAIELRDGGDRCFSETGRCGSRPDTIADPDVTEQSMVLV
jgi:hypothetical protein